MEADRHQQIERGKRLVAPLAHFLSNEAHARMQPIHRGIQRIFPIRLSARLRHHHAGRHEEWARAA